MNSFILLHIKKLLYKSKTKKHIKSTSNGFKNWITNFKYTYHYKDSCATNACILLSFRRSKRHSSALLETHWIQIFYKVAKKKLLHTMFS